MGVADDDKSRPLEQRRQAGELGTRGKEWIEWESRVPVKLIYGCFVGPRDEARQKLWGCGAL